MIVLGIVLLLTTMRVLQPQPLLHWFGTYWPVLIILWGAIKLVEYQQAQKEGTRPAGIGGGGVVLLIFLILFGMSATQASRFNWDEIRDHVSLGDEDFTLFGHNYSYADQLQQDVPPGSSLHIVSDRGAVLISYLKKSYRKAHGGRTPLLGQKVHSPLDRGLALYRRRHQRALHRRPPARDLRRKRHQRALHRRWHQPAVYRRWPQRALYRRWRRRALHRRRPG